MRESSCLQTCSKNRQLYLTPPFLRIKGLSFCKRCVKKEAWDVQGPQQYLPFRISRTQPLDEASFWDDENKSRSLRRRSRRWSTMSAKSFISLLILIRRCSTSVLIAEENVAVKDVKTEFKPGTGWSSMCRERTHDKRQGARYLIREQIVIVQ